MHRRGVIGAKDCPFHLCLCVPGLERVVLRLTRKQRRLAAVGLRRPALFQPAGHSVQVEGLVRVESRAQGHKKQAVLRAHSRYVQGPVKALPQAFGKGQRPAQIQHPALDRTPLRKPRHGLIHYCLINARGNVLGFRPLVNQRLYIALCKHPAAGRDRIGFFSFSGGFVHLVGGHFQKGGHLVNERPRPSGAGTVHPDLHAAGEEEDLRVLAAQLDHHVRAVRQPVCRHPGRIDLLDKGRLNALRHTHARRTGNGQLCLSAELLCHAA